jgi:hypothetical protein
MSQTPAWVDGKPVFPIRRSFAWREGVNGTATLEALQSLDGPAVYARLHGFRGEACFGELFATDVGVVDTVYADTGSKSIGNQLAWFRWDDPSKVGHRVFHPQDFEARGISSALLGNDRLYVALGTNRTVSLNLATGSTERLNLPPADAFSEEDLIYYAGGVASVGRSALGSNAIFWYPDTQPAIRDWIDGVTEPNQIVHMRIDHGKGEVVWTEFAYADGKWSADGLLKVARPITPGGDVSSDNPPLTYLKPYEFRRGMVVNAGALLFIDTNGDAVIVRTTDGKGWRIAQRSPIQHVAPVWIDDAFVWLTVSTQASPTGSRDFTPGGLVRIPRSTLGEAGNVYGL